MSGYGGEVLLMTLKDAEKAFSVSYSALYEGVRSGALPSIRPDRTWRVAPADVMAWLRDLAEKRAESEDS